MLLRITTLLAAVLATGLIAAGCGDDDDETTTTTSSTTTTAGATGATGEPLSKDEFIAQADAICKSGDEDIDAQAEEFFPQGGSPGAAEEEAFVTEVVIPGIQEQIDALRALTPPEGDEDEIGEFLDTAQEALDQIEEDPSTLTGGGSGQNPFAETQQLAADYGLENCAQG